MSSQKGTVQIMQDLKTLCRLPCVCICVLTHVIERGKRKRECLRHWGLEYWWREPQPGNREGIERKVEERFRRSFCFRPRNFYVNVNVDVRQQKINMIHFSFVLHHIALPAFWRMQYRETHGICVRSVGEESCNYVKCGCLWGYSSKSKSGQRTRQTLMRHPCRPLQIEFSSLLIFPQAFCFLSVP